jgi:hypothetical protein
MLQHLIRIKGKTHMVLAINAENSFDKTLSRIIIETDMLTHVCISSCTGEEHQENWSLRPVQTKH